MVNKIQIIAIIGAGALGRRHFQALLNLNGDREYYVVDPFDTALAEARKIADSAKSEQVIHYYQSVNELPADLDFVVIATNSNERFSTFRALAEHSKVRFLIFEKVLFPRLNEYDDTSELLRKYEIKAWVNFPRRMFPEFQEIRKHFFDKGPNVFHATGNMWQLGCNGIHTYDLYAFLTGNTEIQFNTDLLNPEILESKRNGYVEFTGTIYGQSKEGDFFRMTSTDNPVGRMPSIYTISNRDAHVIVRRGAESYYDYALASENWIWKKAIIRSPYQSELSDKIVRQIEESGKPWLTEYAESSVLHKSLIQVFITHMDKMGYDHNTNECLIS